MKNKTAKAEYQHRPQSTSHGHIELDTHADTTVLGSNCVVLSYTGKECEVSPYSSQYEAVQNVPVVTGATVWTNAADGMAYLLIFHESLWMGDKLDHTLVNPNQLRAYGVSIQDNPFDAKPLSITTDDASVELYLDGTIICGDTRTPTESEFSQLPRLILTSPHDWDPHNVCFPSCSGQSSDNISIESDRIPSTTPGTEPPRDARDSGSARSHSMHLETSSSDRPEMVTYMDPQTAPSYMSVKYA